MKVSTEPRDGAARRTRLLRWTLVALPWSILSCFGSPRVSLYALEASSAAIAGTSETGAHSLTLGPIELPTYLDRQQIVTRTAPHLLESSERNRWGEPLNRAVPRALLRAVSARLPGTRVAAFGADRRGEARVAIRFHQLERDPQGMVHLVAHWTVEDREPEAHLLERWTRIEEAAEDGRHAASVAAMSRALEQLADEIAGTVAGRRPG